jgi:hypothetical protein
MNLILDMDKKLEMMDQPHKTVERSVEDSELSMSITQDLDESKLSVFDRSLEKT